MCPCMTASQNRPASENKKKKKYYSFMFEMVHNEKFQRMRKSV